MSNYPPSDQPPGQPPYGGQPPGGQPPGGQPPGGQPPYGGQPPGGQPYGAGGYGGQEPKTSVMAIISLVTGIIGVVLFCCWALPIFPIAATILGFLGNKEINESHGAKKGAGLAKAGLILGIVGLVIAVLYWILFAAGVFDTTFTSDFDT